MNIELRPISLNDGNDIYEMIQEIGPEENGFLNLGHGISLSEFPDFLLKHYNFSKGINIPPEFVPQILYWLYIDSKPVGIGKLRPRLNEALFKIGGHIGYAIRPSERGKGFANLILKELLTQAKIKGVERVLLTVDEDNMFSRKAIEYNNGILENIEEGECRYWITLQNI